MSNVKVEFGLEDKMGHGLRRQVDQVTPIHPIEISERNFAKNEEKAWLQQLQKLQGIHAPLKIMHEKRAAANTGHFPCISTRSNFQLDILEGNDDIITFDDILGRPELYEGIFHDLYTYVYIFLNFSHGCHITLQVWLNLMMSSKRN